MARFASSQGSMGDAINTAVDVANAGQQRSVVALATNSPTLTAAQMVGTILQLSGQTAAQTVTTDTAAAILALIPNAQIGQVFEMLVQNGHTVSGTATLAGGAGVTVTNTYATAAQPIASTRQYRGLVTAVGTPAITIYPVGQVA